MHDEALPKRLRLLHDLVPKAIRVAVLVNPANASSVANALPEVQEAAATLGLQIQILNATTIDEIDAAFAILARERPMPSSSLTTNSSTAVGVEYRHSDFGKACFSASRQLRLCLMHYRNGFDLLQPPRRVPSENNLHEGSVK